MILIPFVHYFDEKKLYADRLNDLAYNADKAVEMMNKQLVRDYEFQKLFQNYYFNVDEERVREMQDMENARKT